MKFYTGIGSRSTPDDVLALMERAAAWLAAQGWTLRSGHAAGADRAFECGAGTESVIYLPWASFGQKPYGEDPGMSVLGHAIALPEVTLLANYAELQRLGIRSPGSPSRTVRLLHGRNYCQVLGHRETGDEVGNADNKASSFVVCWCPLVGDVPQGGTASAILLARRQGIPVVNLSIPADRARIEAKIAG